MRSPRYKTFLRTLYGAVLSSRLSTSDLKALAEELRRGQLADELAYMINRVLEQHLGGAGEGDLEDERVAEAERLIRNGKVSKTALANMMGSLGMPPSSYRESSRDMLDRFISVAPASRIAKLMELLASHQVGDKFLAGISETRK
jgi:hypothetical protein